MTNRMPEEVVEVRVGDSGRTISFLLTDAGRKLARNLTGYAGWVAFWTPSATEPHVTRAGTVDAGNGLVKYTLLGDEFAASGDCYAQATVAAPDWYLGNATGRSSHMVSTDVVRFLVKASPA